MSLYCDIPHLSFGSVPKWKSNLNGAYLVVLIALFGKINPIAFVVSGIYLSNLISHLKAFYF